MRISTRPISTHTSSTKGCRYAMAFARHHATSTLPRRYLARQLGEKSYRPPTLDLMKDLAAATRPPRWREVFAGRRGRLTSGLLLLEALVAVQYLVIATIMPDIRRDLGMTQLYGLAFTSWSLATLA